MSGRHRAGLGLILALMTTWLPGTGAVPRVAAAEYTLETAAEYEVRPADGEIDVTIEITFTNTTPDPEGQFSVFPEVLLAVHDGAGDVTAADAEGELAVAAAPDAQGVNVARIRLRQGVRYEEIVELDLSYTLVDGADGGVRVRPSVIVFPAWGFGTSSAVSVVLPAGYEVRADGDRLTEADDRLVSGPIADPSRWLAVVTATRPGDYTTFESTVPLSGGTADLQVRAFSDDEAWGERTLALMQRALPILEEEIGLPYPRVGALVLTESVAIASAGFGESTTTGTEILVAFDQPPFTALHQVAHVWLSPELIESRWIREGLASDVAARAAVAVELEPPFDPVAEAENGQESAFPLDTWTTSADPDVEAFGHAAAWGLMAELRGIVGADALQTVLGRVAASVGPYESGDVDALPENGAGTRVPLTSRSFLDQLETVTGEDLAETFGPRVFTDADVSLLGPRREARAAFDALVEAAISWGAPDPVRAAMRDWSFDDARELMTDAQAWLEERDGVLHAMEAAGLAAPGRLQQAYRSFGGGPEAHDELEAERAVVEAYAATTDAVNSPRSLLARVGLIGGPDPAQRLTLANGRFADGDLRGAVEAISEAQGILASAETGGFIRLLSVVLVVVILGALAVLLMRRRASYTAAP